jgi:glucose/arabinose dehydrogenase
MIARKLFHTERQYSVITCLLLVFGAFAPLSSVWAEESVQRSLLHSFRVSTIAEGLAHPWSLAFLPDGRTIIVTERDGRLRIIRNGRLLPQSVRNTPIVSANGQGGLFDVVLDPDYPKNNQIYLSYAKSDEKGIGTEVMKAELKGFELLNPKVIFRARPKVAGGRHFGGRMAFDQKKRLYLSLGDRGFRQTAQDPSNHLGSIIRIDKNKGDAISNNPFVDKDSSQFAVEIFSYGHRNPQGMAFRPGTNELWIHEHGPKGGDELNLIKAGQNYGWPKVSFGRNYDGSVLTKLSSAEGMESPVLQWTPSIAPSGMSFYQGTAFPNWKGNLFVGALKFRQIQRLEIKAGKVVSQEVLLKSLGYRIRDIRVGPRGMIYILTDSSDGKVLRLEPIT